MAKEELTAKQKAFCEYYCNPYYNGTRAAIAAGYSPKTAKQIADQNLGKPAIQEYIAERKAQVLADCGASEDELMRFLTAVMRDEIKERYILVTDKRGRKHFSKLHPTVHERLMAADKLARYFGWYSRKATANINGKNIIVYIDDIEK